MGQTRPESGQIATRHAQKVRQLSWDEVIMSPRRFASGSSSRAVSVSSAFQTSKMSQVCSKPFPTQRAGPSRLVSKVIGGSASPLPGPPICKVDPGLANVLFPRHPPSNENPNRGRRKFRRSYINHYIDICMNPPPPSEKDASAIS